MSAEKENKYGESCSKERESRGGHTRYKKNTEFKVDRAEKAVIEIKGEESEDK